MKIAALGDRDPSYLTHREVDTTLALMSDGVECEWVATDSALAADLSWADGVWLLPGSPYRDDEVAYRAIRHCRAAGVPFLGTCAGFQYACVELARELAGVAAAAHAEITADGELVIEPLACSLYGERRTVRPTAGTRLATICGFEPFDGYHYCGYGLADQYARRLSAAGVVLSAYADDGQVEAIELPGHSFFIATAFQPQVGASRSGQLPSLVAALVHAACQ